MATLINPLNQLLNPTELATLIEYKEKFRIRHPDAVILFRVGDFYHIIGDDAQRTMRDLKIRPAITNLPDAKGIKQISFPHADLDTNLPKLVRCGHRVAIAEDIINPTTFTAKRGNNQ